MKAIRLTAIISALCLSAVLFVGCNKADESGYPGQQEAQGNKLFPSATLDAAFEEGINPNSEDYGKIVENAFIKTTDEAVSTFSADVDTASYSYFRKLVNSGYDLSELQNYGGSAFRTEEMVNYFKYNGVTPAENELFGVKTQIAACPWNADAALLCLNLTAKSETTSAGNNFVFLIDVSGSMSSEDKLPLLKTAFSYLTAQLTANDTVSIVTYSGREAVLLEGCNGLQGERIMSAVNSLGASGSTNGEAGLTKAYALAERFFIEGGNNRIIMASDGDLNVGISNADELKTYVEGKRDKGVYLSVLGFGTGNYKDSNMEALADNGNGVYYYIDGKTEAEKVFGDDILSTLYTVAEDVKLQITFDPAYISEYRLVGYENRLLNKEDFTDPEKDAGEVGAGHTVTVCYEIIPTEQTTEAEADAEWLKLAVSYKNPGEDYLNFNEYRIGKAAYTETPDDDFRFICAVIETSMLTRKSTMLGDIGLDNILATLNSLDLSGDSYKTEFRNLMRGLAVK